MIASRSHFLWFSRILDLAVALVSGCHTRYGVLHYCLSLQYLSAVCLYCSFDAYP